MSFNSIKDYLCLYSTEFGYDLLLSIPSRIINDWNCFYFAATLRDFQFHQGLSFTMVVAQHILIISAFQFHQGLSHGGDPVTMSNFNDFQFHQGLSMLYVFEDVKEVRKLSIPSRIISSSFRWRYFSWVWPFQFHQGLSKKCYETIYPSVINFQFHQGLSYGEDRTALLAPSKDFQFHQGLSLWFYHTCYFQGWLSIPSRIIELTT